MSFIVFRASFVPVSRFSFVVNFIPIFFARFLYRYSCKQSVSEITRRTAFKSATLSKFQRRWINAGPVKLTKISSPRNFTVFRLAFRLEPHSQTIVSWIAVLRSLRKHRAYYARKWRVIFESCNLHRVYIGPASRYRSGFNFLRDSSSPVDSRCFQFRRCRE